MGQYYKACTKGKGARNWYSIKPRVLDCGAKLMEHSYVGNDFVNLVMETLHNHPMRLVWAGDYADNEPGKEDNIYFLAGNKTIRISDEPKNYRYAINHTKKQFVDLLKAKKDKWGYRINALPLLTAEGNGRGGGDYCGTNMELVGTWARDFISVSDEKPADFTEIKCDFKEGDYEN